MEAPTSSEPEKTPNRRERTKRYLLYATLVIIILIILYIFVWFGAQLGLQN